MKNSTQKRSFNKILKDYINGKEGSVEEICLIMKREIEVISMKYLSVFERVSLDDLKQEGYISIIENLPKIDLESDFVRLKLRNKIDRSIGRYIAKTFGEDFHYSDISRYFEYLEGEYSSFDEYLSDKIQDLEIDRRLRTIHYYTISLTDDLSYHESALFNLLKKEQTKVLEESLSRLSDREREILYLRIVENKSNREIARIFNITQNRVRQLVLKSLRRLKCSKLNSYEKI